MKVVIADDENRICRLIQALVDWDEIGLELAGFASNGIEALALLKREHPDILITDIRMPGCDGLDLIRRAHEICPDLQIVIISGYANFSYAQTALKYGVYDYLLKPINKEELCETLQKIKVKIEEMRQEEAAHEDTKRHQKEDARKLRQLMIERLLDIQAPTITEEMFEEQYHFPVREGLFLGFCLRVDDTDHEKTHNMMPTYQERMEKVFECGLRKNCYEWSFYQHHFNIYGVLNCAHDRQQDVEKSLQDALNQMNMQQHLFGDTVFTLALGTFETEPTRLGASLQNARFVLKDRLLKGNGRMYLYQERNPVLYEKKLLEQYTRELDHAFETLSTEAVEAANDHLAHEIFDTKDAQGFELFEAVTEAGKLFIIRMNLQDKTDVMKQFEESCNACSGSRELIGTLKEFENRLFREKLDQYEEDSTRPVRLAKQYMKNHYMEQILLDEVSSQVGLSPAYFSVLFKKETDVGFAKYLANLRMEEAKIMLRDTNLSVAEICRKVGYNDQKHFTQMFDKVVGVKPAVFRKLYG